MTDPHTLPPLSFAPLEGINRLDIPSGSPCHVSRALPVLYPLLRPHRGQSPHWQGAAGHAPRPQPRGPGGAPASHQPAEDFIASARLLQDLGYKEVNLNLGCPSGTVVAKKKGAGFLSQPQALARFLDQIFQTLDVNISIKTRIGVENLEEWPPLLDLFQRYPICELIIHPRPPPGLLPGTAPAEAFTYAVAHSRLPCATTGTCSLPRTVGT